MDKPTNKKQQPKPSNKLVTVILASCLILIAGFLIHPKTRQFLLSPLSDQDLPDSALMSSGKPVRNDTESFQNLLISKFKEMELYDSEYASHFYKEDSTLEIKASIPRGKPMEWIIWELTSTAHSSRYKVQDCFCSASNSCVITFTSNYRQDPKIVLKLNNSGRYFSNTAKMAILIEDFGFEANQTTIEFLSFPDPLTVSLVPAQRLSTWTAVIADEYKKEVVILLPMEPIPPQFDKYRQSAVMIHYPEERIRAQISQAMTALPNFSGICNFFGTRAMEDSRVMEIVLSEVKKRGAYFIYSDITRKAIVPSLARRMEVSSYPVQGAIDTDDSPETIKEKLRKYSIAVQKTGRMIIRGPASPAFIQVLKEQREDLRQNGISLVYVSQIIKE